MKTKAQTKYFGHGLPSYKVGQQFLKQSVQRAFVDPAHFAISESGLFHFWGKIWFKPRVQSHIG